MTDRNEAVLPTDAAMASHRRMDDGVAVIITAPHGTTDLGRILNALSDQLGADDRLVVLDGLAAGPAIDPALAPKIGAFEHVRDAGANAFEMRRHVGALSDRAMTVLLEDHAIPAPGFIAEAKRLFASDPAVDAISILARNDTSVTPWSWANFLMTFAGAIHPVAAEPSVLLSTSAVLRTSALPPQSQPLGAWETAFVPAFRREPERLAYSNAIWIDHVHECDIREALLGNFRNQRVIASWRVAAGHRRGKLAVRAFKDIALRRPAGVAKALAGRDEYRHFAANRGRVMLTCWVSAFGAIVGAWFGAGNSLERMH